VHATRRRSAVSHHVSNLQISVGLTKQYSSICVTPARLLGLSVYHRDTDILLSITVLQKKNDCIIQITLELDKVGLLLYHALSIVRAVFPSFKLGTIDLQFVPTFRYLGHIVTESLCDNEDIHREIKNLFIRTNSFVHKFSKCSFMVKCTLFRSYCLSLYDIALWQKYTVTCINKLRSCYSKCIKLFFFGITAETVLLRFLLTQAYQVSIP